MKSSQPPTERLVALDALRGVALFGVLLVNLVTEFRVSAFERYLPQPIEAPLLDRVAERVIAIGFETKPLLVFSFLFGLGLAAQRTSKLHVVRRLSFLFAVGVGHFVFLWSGDILALYAAVAFVAAGLLELPTRIVVALALLLLIVHALPLPYPRPFPSLEAMERHIGEAHRVYAEGSYRDIVAFRLREARPALAALVWSVPRTLALFLLGGCAWRVGLFTDTRARARVSLCALAAIGLVMGGAGSWWVEAGTLRGTWLTIATEASDLLLAFGVGAAVIVAVDVPIAWSTAGRVLRALAPLGRMTLTSYLTESLVLGFVFYGYGLGLFGRLGAAAGVAIAVGLFVVQVLFADWWLRRFRFGPIEWLWRAFSSGSRALPQFRR